MPTLKDMIVCHTAFFVTQIIFGTNLIITRAAFSLVPPGVHISPILIIVGRFILAMTVLTIVRYGLDSYRRRAAISKGHPYESFTKLQLPQHLPSWKLYLLGVVGISVNLIFYIFGVQLTDALTAGAALCANVPAATLIAYISGIDRNMTRLKIVSIVLVVLGNMVMVEVWHLLSTSPSTSPQHTVSYYIGCLCLFLNVISFSAYLVFQKPFIVLMNRWEFLFRVYVPAFGIVVLLGAVNYPLFVDAVLYGLPPIVFVCIAFSGIFNSTIPYWLISVGLEKGTPALAASWTAFLPLVIGIEALLFLGESLSVAKMIGGVLVLGGVGCGAAAQYGSSQLRQCSAAGVVQGHLASGSSGVVVGCAQMELESPRAAVDEELFFS